MLRYALLAAVVIALTPAIALAVPAVTAKATPAAMTSTVKVEKVAIVKQHAKVKKLKAVTTPQHRAKATTLKS